MEPAIGVTRETIHLWIVDKIFLCKVMMPQIAVQKLLGIFLYSCRRGCG
jgi:hypothetical protein